MFLYTPESILASPASTPDQITSDQNNYAFAFTGTTAHRVQNDELSFQRISSDAARTITGIAAKGHAFVYLLANVGSFTITLANESASSDAANRIITGTGANLDIGAGTMALLVYDETSARWRVHPTGSGGGSGVTIEDEGTGQGDATTLNFVGAGVAATVAAGEATITIPGGGAFDPTTTVALFDDFVARPVAGEQDPIYGWTLANGGTGSSVAQVVADASHFGVIQFSTGTTTTGFAAYGNSTYVVFGENLLGGGVITYQCLINIPTLSDATNEYDIIAGMIDGTSTVHIDGVYFKYDRNTSANWLRGSMNNSTATESDSGTAVATGWTTLKIVVNAGATSVEYFVNGTSVGSNTTNIPSTAGREVGILWSIEKSAGTTARTMQLDYVKIDKTFTTAR